MGEMLIDEVLGLEYCGESKEFYEEIKGMYREEADEKKKLIRDSYETENWVNYAVYLHSLKTTSLNIGARGLSEKAKALELAARKENIAYVKENHADCMDLFEKVLLAL